MKLFPGLKELSDFYTFLDSKEEEIATLKKEYLKDSELKRHRYDVFLLCYFKILPIINEMGYDVSMTISADETVCKLVAKDDNPSIPIDVKKLEIKNKDKLQVLVGLALFFIKKFNEI